MPEPARMRGLTPNELIAWTPPIFKTIIGENILVDQGTMCIYGTEGTYKSMLVLDLSFRISKGMDWFGYHTTLSPVYMFQSEIPQTFMRERMLGYMQGNKLATDNIWFCSELYEKIDKGWGYTELEREINRTCSKVLFIDPLYNSVSAKLVDDYEMGIFTDRMNMLRSKYKLSIILVGHDRKPEHSEGESFHYGTDELFGSGRLKKWLDTIIYVELKNDGDSTMDLKLTFEKHRHTKSKLPPIDVTIFRSDLTFRRKETL